jgi:hypothetical protein
MVIMNNKLIEKYINSLTINQVKNFLEKNNIKLSDKEFNYLYNYVKNNYLTILYNDPTNDVKANISHDNYQKLEDLYYYYKKKYYNYL